MVPCKRLAAAAAGQTVAVEAWLHAAGYPRVAGVDEAGVGAIAGPLVVAAVVLHPPFAGGEGQAPGPPARKRPGHRLDLSGVGDCKALSAAARAAVVARLPPPTEVVVWRAVPLLSRFARWALLADAGGGVVPPKGPPALPRGGGGDDGGGVQVVRLGGGAAEGVEYAVAVAPAALVDHLGPTAAAATAMAAAVGALPGGLPEALLIDGDPPGGAKVSKTVAGVPPGVGAVVYLRSGDRLAAAVSVASILARETRDEVMAEAAAAWPGYGFGDHGGHPGEAHLAALAARGPCPIHRRSCKPVKRAVATHGGPGGKVEGTQSGAGKTKGGGGAGGGAGTAKGNGSGGVKGGAGTAKSNGSGGVKGGAGAGKGSGGGAKDVAGGAHQPPADAGMGLRLKL
ncbi:hypothetical protein I4F81_009250 [Pyropia yezoensis]|uniref:Uncharacterized protein n=1 Tax=Pyropia yezoensis TaxID=2788 RepID=A0ACC3C9T1_PYRYE|nr:hypothetical protein I4F81_009250 [Neopyropia yezoensis]